MQIYGRYQHTRDAAWQCLLDYRISKLPVSLSSICAQAGIKILQNKKANVLKEGEFGISVLQQNCWYIVYDDSDNYQRIRFTIAHELGHIMLGHAMQYGYFTRKNNLVKPDCEYDADMFASRLLAPSCVLWGLGLQSAEEIAEICEISFTAARIRAERLNLLRQRNKFLISPLERKVYQQFEQFINESKCKRS